MQFSGRFPGHGFTLEIHFQDLERDEFEREVAESFHPVLLERRARQEWEHPDPTLGLTEYCGWRYFSHDTARLSMIIKGSQGAEALDEACAFSLKMLRHFESFYHSNEFFFDEDAAGLSEPGGFSLRALEIILSPHGRIVIADDVLEYWTRPVGFFRSAITGAETVTLTGIRCT